MIPVTCEWCKAPIPPKVGGGKVKKYCSRSHLKSSLWAKQHPPKPPMPVLPAGPLLRHLRVAELPPSRACKLAGIWDSHFDHATDDTTIPFWVVDQIAVKVLNLHPIVLYGDDWLDADEFQSGLNEDVA